MHLDERLFCCVQGSCNLSLSRENNNKRCVVGFVCKMGIAFRAREVRERDVEHGCDLMAWKTFRLGRSWTGLLSVASFNVIATTEDVSRRALSLLFSNFVVPTSSWLLITLVYRCTLQKRVWYVTYMWSSAPVVLLWLCGELYVFREENPPVGPTTGQCLLVLPCTP